MSLKIITITISFYTPLIGDSYGLFGAMSGRIFLKFYSLKDFIPKNKTQTFQKN